MKNITKLFILPLLLFTAVSCSDDDNKTTVAGLTAPTLSSAQSGTALVLTQATQDDNAIKLDWTDAAFTLPTEITYTAEASLAGTQFDSIVVLGRSTTGTLSLSVAELNGYAVQAGLTSNNQGQLDIRVTASIGTSNTIALPSNVLTFTITPYTNANPKIYLRGNFTGASGYGPDWGDNTTPPFLEANGFGSTAFEGFIFMNVATPEFKLIPTNVGFDGDYGDAAASGASGVLVQEGETNIKPGPAGYYFIKADTDELTYSATATVWGIVGNATPGGWDNSTPMTYDAATKKWTITAVMSAQTAPNDGWKFRANNNWDISLGDAVLNQTDGKLILGGGSNIGITTAGTYKITLDLSNPRAYTYTIERQ